MLDFFLILTSSLLFSNLFGMIPNLTHILVVSNHRAVVFFWETIAAIQRQGTKLFCATLLWFLSTAEMFHLSAFLTFELVPQIHPICLNNERKKGIHTFSHSGKSSVFEGPCWTHCHFKDILHQQVGIYWMVEDKDTDSAVPKKMNIDFPWFSKVYDAIPMFQQPRTALARAAAAVPGPMVLQSWSCHLVKFTGAGIPKLPRTTGEALPGKTVKMPWKLR